MTEVQSAFITKAVSYFQKDQRICGVAAAGSGITGQMDEYSDVDLVIAVDAGQHKNVLTEKESLAAGLGQLLTAYGGEHVGEPRLLICFYGKPFLHVDYKFVSVDDLKDRVEEYRILWEREGILTAKFAEKPAAYPLPDLQWIETRFWAWVHYTTNKIGRGEIFEAVESLSFLRRNVLGPLVLLKKGAQPNAVRRLEFHAPEYTEELRKTVPAPDAESCFFSLRASIDLYLLLREELRSLEFLPYDEMKNAALTHLDDISRKRQ